MAISQYKLMGPNVGGIAVSDIDTVKRFPLGLEISGCRMGTAAADLTAFGQECGVFKYVQGSNIGSAGQFAMISAGSAVLLAAAASAAKWPIGVACAALTATSQFGWVQVEGPCDFARGTNSSIAAAVPLYIAAGTAGLLVTNVVNGNQVLGVMAPVSYTSSQSSALSVNLARPFLVGLSASI